MNKASPKVSERICHTHFTRVVETNVHYAVFLQNNIVSFKSIHAEIHAAYHLSPVSLTFSQNCFSVNGFENPGLISARSTSPVVN